MTRPACPACLGTLLVGFEGAPCTSCDDGTMRGIDDPSREELRIAELEAANAALKATVRAAHDRLHRGFGWLNYPPRGLCVCHEIQGGPEYTGEDDYKPPADDDHDGACDTYNATLKILRAALTDEEARPQVAS